MLKKGLFWSLGIYAFIIILLFVLYVLYFLVKYIVKRFPCCKIVQKYMKRKLFFSSAIRFMVESNLKITHNSIYFLLMFGSFKTTKESVSTMFTFLFLGMIVLWPIFLTVFLLYNRTRLEDHDFQKRFHSMYLRIKTDKYLGS